MEQKLTCNMKSFLEQIAEVYLENERGGMMDFCFVFPNKRSGTFFRHHLMQKVAGQPFIMPEIATIGDLTARIVPLVEAPRMEQLFILYNEYRKIGGEDIDFDRFMFWGEMILSDFNDVDLYLVDPGRLFVNLKRYREVNANYLTDDQRAILEKYWGEQFTPHSPEKFWQHLHYDSPTPLEQKFLKLWEVLDPLYRAFTSTLRGCGMGTQGMIVRDAVEHLRRCRTSDLSHARYIFVGFNVLTLAELSIFGNLDARGVADFYWDNASPAMRVKGNAASRFIDRNAARFKSRYDLNALYPIADGQFPEITLTGLPSAIGQAKMAGHTLAGWIEDGTIADTGNAIDTAVVLPDDSLLIPMIHSIPRIKCEAPAENGETKEEATREMPLNVTMGLPMRTTSFASLINSLVSLHLRATETRGEWCYFHEDVKKVISHPLLSTIDRDGCNALTTLFATRRVYMLPASEARYTAPGIGYVFTPIADPNSIEDVYSYFHTLLTSLREALKPDDNKVEVFFIHAYLDALNDLKNAADRWGVEMRDSTFIQLLQRAIAGVSVNFVGEPLRGLQIMGVLETRALDFNNLILLSMNEHIFPRKHYTRSFIPDTLRQSYGMATTDYQESIYAYYFYRLISRAQKVTIYYDSRNGPTYTSEMSRYITQLLYLHPECKIHHSLGSYEFTPKDKPVISIERTPEIKQRLRSFCTPGGKRLSASLINDYINCPLQFYLKSLCELNTDTEPTDYMDSATYGSIVHAVVQQAYMEWKGDAPAVKVTAEMLDSLIHSKGKLDRLITEAVNDLFNKRGKGDTTPLIGEAKVMGNLTKYILTRMFEQEKQFAPFDFIAAELLITGTMTLAPDLTINIKQYLDRVDRVYPPGHYGDPTQGTIRIIDYKTGGDATAFKDLDQLFDPTVADRRKAILQLMFYAKAYAEKTRYEGPIQPFIYKFRTIYTEGLKPIMLGKAPFTDYHEILDEYMERFEALVREIVLSDTPFTQAKKEESCEFCQFKLLCRRS